MHNLNKQIRPYAEQSTASPTGKFFRKPTPEKKTINFSSVMRDNSKKTIFDFTKNLTAYSYQT